MKHLFILNPVAGGKRVDHNKVRANIERFMNAYGEKYEIYETTGRMDAAEKVMREASKGEELRIYACGGDGTLSECAHGAAGFKNAAVTQYPCGTGNDFVRIFGNTECFKDLSALVGGTVRPLDIIDVNGRRCINIFSVGIDARVGADVHKYSELPLVGGAGGYIVSLLVNFVKGVSSHMHITADDYDVDGEFALACACNGRYYGGGFNPTNKALPDDGELEILIIKKLSRLKIALLIKDYAAGKYEKYPDIIKHIKGRHMTIESESPFTINVDGEMISDKKAVIRLLPGGVNFIYPKGCEPLGAQVVNNL